jgi:N-acetylmuramic acid 6-phosphate etherase
MEKVTEQSSHYRHLEKMPVEELLVSINKEDKTVPTAVEKCIPSISPLVEVIIEKMRSGGRLFYLGAGTSGRLGIVDASECPPTFGVPHDWVIGIISGGDEAIRKSKEFAEDDTEQAWKDLSFYGVDSSDVVIGIAASGTTPYVVSGLKKCQQQSITTGCITCNPDSPLKRYSDFPIEAIVGPEFVTGSTRMKAGTAQKLILNMISTSVMVGLGRIRDKVDMQLSNNKLLDRGTKIVQRESNLSYNKAKEALLKAGSVRATLDLIKKQD